MGQDWSRDSVPEWVRWLSDAHVETDVFLGSSDPPRQRTWVGKKGYSAIIGLVLILGGYMLDEITPYWSSGASGLGTTLIGLSVYWWLQDAW